MFMVHLCNKSVLFWCEIHAFASQRDQRAGAAALDFGKFGIG